VRSDGGVSFFGAGWSGCFGTRGSRCPGWRSGGSSGFSSGRFCGCTAWENDKRVGRKFCESRCDGHAACDRGYRTCGSWEWAGYWRHGHNYARPIALRVEKEHKDSNTYNCDIDHRDDKRQAS